MCVYVSPACLLVRLVGGEKRQNQLDNRGQLGACKVYGGGQVRVFLHDVSVGHAWAVSRSMCRRCGTVCVFFHRHAFWFGLWVAKNAKANLIIAGNWGVAKSMVGVSCVFFCMM
jgi:hypothetical protein